MIRNSYTLRTLTLMAMGALMLTACTRDMYWPQGAQNMSQAAPNMPQTLSGHAQYASMSSLKMNNQGSEALSEPEKEISATAAWNYDCPACNATSNNQILVGLAGRSAQACIYDGGNKGSGTASFTLKTPAVPGTYDVRFRSAQAENCQAALKTWWTMGSAPSKAATIGKITVIKYKS